MNKYTVSHFVCMLPICMATQLSSCMTIDDKVFLLDNEIANQLIVGVTKYRQDALNMGYAAKHPVVEAYQEILDMLPDNSLELSSSARAYRVATRSDVYDYLQTIYVHYHCKSKYNDAFNNAIAESQKYQHDSQEVQSAWKHATQTTCTIISNSIGKLSSFKCPTEKNQDYTTHLKTLLDNNTTAEKEDIPVFIAGVYALFVQMQEKKDAIAAALQNKKT